MRLTENFTLEELTASTTARARKIDNTPNELQKSNLLRLAKEILQPVRNRWGKPIIITSGYRSPALNKAVGGVATSQHLQGEAADINLGKNNPELFRLMKQMVANGEITVGQLLDENGGSWIHVSLPNGKWRNYVNSIWS
ncbi:MAG: DUF882 domain-containing protein [Muribaculaceae bacterium]|nr:DUF882 domain-containing protein [Muribaculaceae bacterium]